MEDPDKKTTYQLRYCASVEKIGDFVKDPDDDVIEIRLINPADYRSYFDWGEIGDSIIRRAIELNKEL